MSRPKRLALVLTVLVGVASIVGVWRHQRAKLTDEEQQYVGTWAVNSGGVWEIRSDRTLVCRGTDPFTREPVVRSYRWSVRDEWLALAPQEEGFSFLSNSIQTRGYVVLAKEPGQFSTRDESGVVAVLTRQGAP